MKKLVLPYKIRRIEMPDSGILIKGRALGPYAEYAMIVLVLDITTFLLWHPKHYVIFAAAGAILLCALPFICRFRIEIRPESVQLQTKMLGMVIKEAGAPLQRVIVLNREFIAAHKAAYSDYLKNKDEYLAFEFDKEFFEPTDYIAVHFKGRVINLTLGQKEYGQELWDCLIPALKQVIDQNTPVDTAGGEAVAFG